ncbi:MAG: 50S ribosomal protein L18e [Nanoarchaeota archaeon]
MKSKTKIEKQVKLKTNPDLVQTILNSKNNNKWVEIAKILSMPRRKKMTANLGGINNEAKDGETIVFPGKILSQGELEKKIKLVALNFSESAKEKLKNGKKEFSTIIEEIKKNPDAKGIRIIKEK